MSRRTALAPAAPKSPPASWAGRTVVVLLGGPWHRSWYFEDDLEQIVQSRRRIGLPWHYRPTAAVEPHPLYDAVGAVHRYSPLGGAR